MPIESYFTSVNNFMTPTGIIRIKISQYASWAIVLLYNRTFFITVAIGVDNIRLFWHKLTHSFLIKLYLLTTQKNHGYSNAMVQLTNKHVSCRIFEHFALQTDSVTEFIKLGSALFKEVPLWHQSQLDPLSFWRSSSTLSKTGSSKPDQDPLIFCTI